MASVNTSQNDSVAPPTPIDPESLDMCSVRLVNPERVAEVRKRIPSNETFGEMARTFQLLAEPARLRIVAALLEAGELCVCDLAATVGLTETSTSQHLRILRGQRTVRSRRDGRMVYYTVDDPNVRELVGEALSHEK